MDKNDMPEYEGQVHNLYHALSLLSANCIQRYAFEILMTCYSCDKHGDKS